MAVATTAPSPASAPTASTALATSAMPPPRQLPVQNSSSLPSCLTQSCPQAADLPIAHRRILASCRATTCSVSCTHYISINTAHLASHPTAAHFHAVFPVVLRVHNATLFRLPVTGSQSGRNTESRGDLGTGTKPQIAGVEDRRATDLLSLLSQHPAKSIKPAMPAEPQS